MARHTSIGICSPEASYIRQGPEFITVVRTSNRTLPTCPSVYDLKLIKESLAHILTNFEALSSNVKAGSDHLSVSFFRVKAMLAGVKKWVDHIMGEDPPLC